MASSYSRWGPSTGPGNYYGAVPQFVTFQSLGIGVSPGIGYYSSLGINNTPDPGPPAPASDVGILLANSLNSFIELETLDGWLTLEP